MVHGFLTESQASSSWSLGSLTPRHLTAKVTRSPEALKQGRSALHAPLTGSFKLHRRRASQETPCSHVSRLCRLGGISEIMLVTKFTAELSTATAAAACIASLRHERDVPCWHGAKAISQVYRRCREEHRARRERVLQSVPFRRRTCRSP